MKETRFDVELLYQDQAQKQRDERRERAKARVKELPDLITGMGRRKRRGPVRRLKVEKPLPQRHPDMISRVMPNGDCRVEKYDREGKLVELLVNGEKQPLPK